MKKHFIVIFLLLCGLGVFVKAQTVWNKTYVEDRPVMLFTSIVSDDTCYKIVGGTYGYINNLGKGMIGNIDLSGNLTDYKILVDSNTHLYGIFNDALIENIQGEYVFTGQSYDSLAYLLFCIANKQLDSISVFRYYTPNTLAFHGQCLLQKGNDYFVSGARTDSITNNPNVVLVKIDSNANRIWEKNYGNGNCEEAKSITALANGNLMLGAVTNDLNKTHQRANTWLLEVDTAGTLVRQWFDSSDSTYAAFGLKQTSDGGFIYGAQKKSYQTINDVIKTATIVKLDNNFNKQWVFDSDSLCPDGFTDIEILADGNYIACGSKNYRYAWIVKLGSTGQKLWSREYVGITDWGSTSYLYDIDVLPDGGFIAVGQSQKSGHTPPQVGWFLKLDSNGCEIENCLTGISQFSIQHSEFSIYPNPARDNFSLDIENPLLQGGSLVLYNIDGKKLSSTANNFTRQTKVDISQLSNGIYLWRYTAPNQTVQSGKVVKE